MKKSSVLNRYFIFIAIFIAFGIAIILRASWTMFVERSHWQDAKDRFVRDSVAIPANRGKIFSSDGKLLASSLPQYKLYMDYKFNVDIKKELFKEKIDSVSQGLAKILPGKGANYFKRKINAGLRAKNKSAHDVLYPERISYLQYQSILELPVFREGSNKSGLHHEEYNNREKPFGTLASRTIGSLFLDMNEGAKNGLEKSFDHILMGKDGLATRMKVKNRFLSIVKKKPVDGDDIISTLNVDIQDISEKALVDKLRQENAMLGVVLVMEVKTGDIKAIVNMTRGSDGRYREEKNNAVIDLFEPGSTIKAASILTALNDNKTTREHTVNLGNGTYNMHGKLIRDHNWRNQGFKDDRKIQTLDEIMMNSSNIGVGVTIEQAYKDNKQQFIDGLKNLVGMNLDLQLEGVAKPIIKNTDEKGFSLLTIPWMSFGYETLIPPINMVTFYNAIANDGVMVKPRFVKAVSRDGSIIKRYDTEVINSKIASSSAIKDIQEILERVVDEGTGKRAKSEQFRVAGKTGTAQLSQGSSGYRAGGLQHILSFCGYFPAEKPEYTILVNIKSSSGGGGGLQCAEVFKEIAEHIYAINLKPFNEVNAAKDTINPIMPYVQKGLLSKTVNVLSSLNIDYDNTMEENNMWAQFETKDEEIIISDTKVLTNIVPSVYGMGARDAVYALELAGLTVSIKGKGKVFRQSIQNGLKVKSGTRINIELR